MGNVYMIAKIGNEIVDLTDVKKIMVHRGENYEQAEKMLNSGMDIDEVAEYFCTNCGGYMPNKVCNCGG